MYKSIILMLILCSAAVAQVPTLINYQGFLTNTSGNPVADGNGNAYVTGFSPGSGTSEDYATIRYDHNGTESWVERYNGQANASDQTISSATDAFGKVFVTGGSTGTGSDYDDVTIRYRPSDYHDVGVVSILSPPQVPEHVPYCPEGLAKNFGVVDETFWTYCQIDSGGLQIYLDSVLVEELFPESSLVVSFELWTPGEGGIFYPITIYTARPSDAIPTNDAETCTTEAFNSVERWLWGETLFLIRSAAGVFTEFDLPLLFPGNSTEITIEVVNTDTLSIDSVEVILIYAPPGSIPTSDSIIAIDSIPAGGSSGPLIFTFNVWPYARGDLSTDRSLGFTDLIFLRNYLYLGGTVPDPILVADINGDMVVNDSDLVCYEGFMVECNPEPNPQPVQNPPVRQKQEVRLCAPDDDGDGKWDWTVDKDDDNDGIPDYQDSAPHDPKKGRDTDKDGIPDPQDDDIDNDGTPNGQDVDDDGDGNPDDFEKEMLDSLEKLNEWAARPAHASLERVIKIAILNRHDFDGNGTLEDDDLFNSNDFPGLGGLFRPEDDGKGTISITPSGQDDLLQTMIHEMRHAYQHWVRHVMGDRDKDGLPDLTTKVDKSFEDNKLGSGDVDEDGYENDESDRRAAKDKLERDAEDFAAEHLPPHYSKPAFFLSSDTTYDFDIPPNRDTLTAINIRQTSDSSVSVLVTLTHADSLTGIVLPLSYDPNLLVVSNISISSIFSTWTQCVRINADTGKLMIQLANGLEPPISPPLPPGTDTVATIEFTVDPSTSYSFTYIQNTTYPPVNCLLLVDAASPPSGTIPVFVRGRIGALCGDANADGTVDISDAVSLISYIFSGGPAPNPLLSGDANCDQVVDISDAVYLISYIFSGGLPPCAGCK